MAARRFEHIQLKIRSKWLKMAHNHILWPISEGLAGNCCIFSQLLPSWVVQHSRGFDGGLGVTGMMVTVRGCELMFTPLERLF